MKTMTARQQAVLDYFRDFLSRCGYSPTLRDISRHFGFTQAAAAGYVTTLRAKGVLRQLPGNRGCVPIEEPLETIWGTVP